MQRVTANTLAYYQFDDWPVAHGVFTRHGGESDAPWASLNLGGNVGDNPDAVRANYEHIYRALDIDGERACSVWQVHSADVVIADRPAEGRRWLAKADGMVTDKPETPLVMRYADCTPVLLHDAVKQVVGIAHAGWRGTVAGAARNTVQAMVDAYGSTPADIRAGIGPSIGPARYQVGEEVVAAVLAYYGTTEGLINRDPADGSAYLDLWAANTMDLNRAGVTDVQVMGLCTATRTDEFYSHRAENGKTGRFAAVLSL